MADGYSLLWRRFFEHRFWIERRAFSRAEAFLDCFANLAAWKDHKAIRGGVAVDIARGQFVASDRFLENRWQWSRGKVRRFIAECVAEGELGRVGQVNGTCDSDGTAGGTIYHVVNFELYQSGGTASSTAHGTDSVPRTDQREVKKRKKINTSSPSAFDLLFEAIWLEYPRKVNKQAALKAWNKLILRGDPKAIEAGIFRYTAYVRAMETEQRFIKHLASLLNSGEWQDDWAIEGVVPFPKAGEPEEWWLKEKLV